MRETNIEAVAPSTTVMEQSNWISRNYLDPVNWVLGHCPSRVRGPEYENMRISLKECFGSGGGCDLGLVSTTKIISINLAGTQKFDTLVVEGMAVVPETHTPLMK